MALTLDLVKNKKNAITVSNKDSGASPGLETIHTVKDPLTWDMPDDDTTWIKFNAYENYKVSRVRFSYTGTCTSYLIERSFNNFEWDVISSSFNFDSENIEEDISYPDPEDFQYIRLTITAPVSFVITDFEVYAELSIENDTIISHNFYTLYYEKEREENPFFPSIVKNLLEQWEGLNDLDLKTFDSDIFSGADIVIAQPGGAGGSVELTGVGIPIDADNQYIWDYDDPNVNHISGTEGIINIASSVGPFDLQTDVDFTAFSVDELVGKQLEINSGTLNKREFLIASHTALSSGNTITVDSGDAFDASETSVDWQINNFTRAFALTNPNIIVTTNPLLTQGHFYTIFNVEYVTRLLLINPGYSLEWTAFFRG